MHNKKNIKFLKWTNSSALRLSLNLTISLLSNIPRTLDLTEMFISLNKNIGHGSGMVSHVFLKELFLEGHHINIISHMTGCGHWVALQLNT